MESKNFDSISAKKKKREITVSDMRVDLFVIESHIYKYAFLWVIPDAIESMISVIFISLYFF